MSVYDARATRMWPSFERKLDLRPYDAIIPAVVPFGDPGAPVNGPNAPLAELSARMDFSKPDAAPENALSAAVWKSVRGADSKMPAPRHSLLLPPRPSGARPGEGGIAPRRRGERRRLGEAG